MRLLSYKQESRQLDQILQSVIDVFPGDLSVIDPDYNIIYSNVEPRNPGIDKANIIGEKCYRYCNYIQKSPEECYAKQVYRKGEAILRQQVQLKNDKWVEINCLPIKNENGKVQLVVEFISDISLYKETEASLKESEERWHLALEGNNDGIWDWNIRTNEVFFSERWKTMLGYSNDELPGVFSSFSGLVHPADIGVVMKGIHDHMRQKTPHFSMEYRIRCKEGQYKWVLGRAQATWDNEGNAIRMTGSHTDITERKIREQEINYLTFHDKLTGLYNRAFFEDAIERLNTERMLPLSLIIGDVNGLKVTNDIFGHHMGDELLKKIAEILKKSCRKEDVIARWGGDEFAILLPKTAEKVTLDICRRITEACENNQEEIIKPSISLGAATKVRISHRFNELIKEAEDLMYRHKLLESQSNQSVLISSLEKTLFERSTETEEHAQRMKIMGFRLGKELNLTAAEQDALSLLCVLHDIGKIAITDSILKKAGSLSSEEWHQMKKHPEIGYRIAKSSNKLEHIAEFILFHHERWDGGGYPKGLKGEETPRLSRLLAIIDAYDVMTHERVYKQPRTHKESIKELKRCAGTQFDPDMVKAFVKLDIHKYLQD
ncbi:MAG: diguanylate cyclase [Tindallia sp. MSAO_Bac2]|nr:MAG: diguanylate cyclase [Tindallia sp. MSAO_Bac2]